MKGMFSKSSATKILENIRYLLILFVVVSLPFFVDAKNYNNYILPKSYLLACFTLLSLILWGIKSFIERRLTYNKTVMDKPVAVLLAIGILSSLFSIAQSNSFIGRGDYFILHFTLLAIMALFAWQVVQLSTSVRRWQHFLNIIIITGAISATFFVLKTVFNVDILGKAFPGIWNTIDSTNINFGVWVAIIFLISSGQLIKKALPVSKVFVNFYSTIISFLALLTLGFASVWWLVLVGLILLILVGLGFIKDARFGWLVTLFGLTVAVTVFVIFGSPKVLQSNLPLEVSLGRAPSYIIASKTISSGVKEFLFGTGAGSFSYDFSKFRDASFNYDKSVVALRFNYPFSTAYSLVAENGILFVLAMVFFVVYLLAHAVRNWRAARAGMLDNAELVIGDLTLQHTNTNRLQGMDAFLITVPWVVLTGGMLVIFYSITLWWLWWFVLALIVVGFGLFNPATIQEKNIDFNNTPERNATFSFGIFTVIGIVIILFIVGARWYMADRLFSVARAAEFTTAEESLKKSISYRNTELSRAALAQVYLNEAVRISKDSKPDLKQISELMGKAVAEAKISTEMAPESIGLWENLATMYENAAALVPDARDWAIKSLVTARQLEPTNALLAWRLGNNYELAKKWPEAIQNYQDAINLKKDFTESYTSLANAYEQNKQSDKALDTFSTVLQGSPTDLTGQYNYGRLLYNRNQKGDRDAAEQLWLAVVEKQPNYSNALFSLGVLYELKKDYSKALGYFYKVKELNPLKADKSNAEAVKSINDKISKLIKK